MSKNKHCGGGSINKWNDGTSSNYGSVKEVSKCKEECAKRVECTGFIHRSTDNVCGFWKKGPFNLFKSANHHCYKKGLNFEQSQNVNFFYFFKPMY